MQPSHSAGVQGQTPGRGSLGAPRPTSCGDKDHAGSGMCRTSGHAHWYSPESPGRPALPGERAPGGTQDPQATSLGPLPPRRPLTLWSPQRVLGGRTASRGRSPPEADPRRQKSPYWPLADRGCWRRQERGAPHGWCVGAGAGCRRALPSSLQAFLGLGTAATTPPNPSRILGRSGTPWRGPAPSLLPAQPAPTRPPTPPRIPPASRRPSCICPALSWTAVRFTP